MQETPTHDNTTLAGCAIMLLLWAAGFGIGLVTMLFLIRLG